MNLPAAVTRISEIFTIQNRLTGRKLTAEYVDIEYEWAKCSRTCYSLRRFLGRHQLSSLAMARSRNLAGEF